MAFWTIHDIFSAKLQNLYEINNAVNTLGKEMQAGAFKVNGTFAQAISIENLPAGLYFLQLRDKSGWGSLKFVKE